jgi:hypothetical protein
MEEERKRDDEADREKAVARAAQKAKLQADLQRQVAEQQQRALRSEVTR